MEEVWKRKPFSIVKNMSKNKKRKFITLINLQGNNLKILAIQILILLLKLLKDNHCVNQLH